MSAVRVMRPLKSAMRWLQWDRPGFQGYESRSASRHHWFQMVALFENVLTQCADAPAMREEGSMTDQHDLTSEMNALRSQCGVMYSTPSE